LLKLPPGIALRIKTAINKLAENPRHVGCVKLKGSVNAYRLRIGSYRVIYTIGDSLLIITIIKISHRRSAYR
jgi:mRNA interferase RelE/StbE